jgi:hypothetical protein
VLLWVLSSSYFDGFTANVYIIIILRISNPPHYSWQEVNFHQHTF